MSRRRTVQTGFTLIELMIVVAIVAIVAAVAYPSYTQFVLRSHRSEAQALLMDVVNRQQQYLLDTRNYADSLSTLNVAVPAAVEARYTLALEVGADPAPTFTLSAEPKAAQADDKCGTLSVDQAGRKAPAGCW